jgi:hypothetical protein
MLGRRGQFSKKKIGGGPAHSSSRIRRAAREKAHKAGYRSSFDLFMNDTCLKCHKPLNSAAIEPHPTRRDLAVHKFIRPSCGTVKTKTLLRKKGKLLPDKLAA